MTQEIITYAIIGAAIGWFSWRKLQTRAAKKKEAARAKEMGAGESPCTACGLKGTCDAKTISLHTGRSQAEDCVN